MHDISAELLPPGVITDDQLDVVVRGMAALHAAPPPDDVPWCDVRARLLLLSSAGAEIAASYGAPVARDLIEGWRLFARHATPAAVRLVEALHADLAPLLSALAPLPTMFLHGDLKFDNVGIDDAGRLWLIDWAMTMHAPAAVELGWFLAINSRRLPCSPDDAMALYARHAGLAGNVRKMHDGLSVICGLVLRGWRKALDADASEPAELRWWCERAEAAERFLP
jgi:aminoglycoside phosphotransferase (APT) family kinase protein